jgi:hypothetical protein
MDRGLIEVDRVGNKRDSFIGKLRKYKGVDV